MNSANSQTIPRARNHGPRGLRRLTFVAAALIIGSLPLVLLEGTLRVLNIGRSSAYTDPFVGFSTLHSLFELRPSQDSYETTQAQRYFFGRQSFSARKPAKNFRIFCLGGSTVLGHPFQPDTAFPHWLTKELSSVMDRVDVDAINCGGMSYASYRLVPILKEVLGYKPDLIVVMTGHNEFLEDRSYGNLKNRSAARARIENALYSLHTVTLARRLIDKLRGSRPPGTTSKKTVLGPAVNARLDHATGFTSYKSDPMWHLAVNKHFAYNLRQMVKLCQQARVPLMFVKPGSNLRDCPPFKSEHRDKLDMSSEHRWDRLFGDAKTIERKNPEKALELYRQAAAIDDQYALLSYRIARCLDRLGQIGKARAHYERARDQDVCPLRMTSQLQKTLMTVAEETSTPLLDADTLVQSIATSSVPGNENYVDHVHPGVRGHQRLGRALAKKIFELGLVKKTNTWSTADRQQAYRRKLSDLGPVYFAQGRARVKYLDRWARRDPLLPDLQPYDIRGALALVQAQLEFGEFNEASSRIREVLKADPDRAGEIRKIAESFEQSGRNGAAKVVLECVN